MIGSKIDMWAVVCFYVPVFQFGHSGTIGDPDNFFGTMGWGDRQPEPWWCVFKCSPSNQRFACVMIDYFLICIFAPWVRSPWHNDFSCLSYDCSRKAVSSLPALKTGLKYREKEQYESGQYCLLTVLQSPKITFFSSTTLVCVFKGE